MGYCTLHFQKNGKPGRGDLGNHIDRVEGKEYSYRHADLSLTKNNISLPNGYNSYSVLPFNDAIKKRVEDGYTGKKALRKDAIWSVNTILTGSHEEMKEIEANPEKFKKWVEANQAWCEDNFGRDNIVRFTVHLDEKTPHIHCVWVPITKDGRLSAQEWVGNSKKLEAMQTSYAEKMKQFGLERGISSDKKHVDTEVWRRERALNIKTGEELKNKIDNIRQIEASFSLKKVKEELKTAVDTTILNAQKEARKDLLANNENLYKENRRIIKLAQEYAEIMENKEPIEKKYMPKEDVQNIIDNSNVIDYFLHLSQKGLINFEYKSGKEYIFSSSDKSMKISASERGWRNFKSGEGGKIVKAVMKFEQLEWLQAVHFLNNFNNNKVYFDEIKTKIRTAHPDLGEDDRKVTFVTQPNNAELISYFKKRGISYDTLANYAKQVHFQHGNKHLFGIGTENISKGYDIRLPFDSNGKSKIGQSNFSVINYKKANKMIVFEGFTDLLSMVEILKAQGKNLDEYCLVSLNSVTNVDKLTTLSLNKNFRDKIKEVTCILDGDKAGDEATKKIIEALPYSKDGREYFNIGSGHEKYNDLNEYLVKSIEYNQNEEQQKSRGIRW